MSAINNHSIKHLSISNIIALFPDILIIDKEIKLTLNKKMSKTNNLTLHHMRIVK
jgi:hypothetical protein